MILLSGCGHGRSGQINASADFLGEVIDERDAVIACCPAHNEIVKDWIASNAP